MTDQPPLRHKSDPPVRVLTIVGEIELRRRYFWLKTAGGVYPADTSIGITLSKASPAACEACCTMGVVQDFAQGAEDLRFLTGLRVGKERLRQITESEAAEVQAMNAAGMLPPSWSATEAIVAPNGPIRVYVGADGVMVRTVTQEEKVRRRGNHAVRRQQRGRTHLGNARPLSPPRPGSDDRFKEMKIGLFYDQGKTRVHAFATNGNHEAFGALLRKHADAIHLERAQEFLSLTDGGPWIRNQILQHLPHLHAMLLDFFHLSQHVWATAHACLGPGDEAKAWARQQLHDLKHVGPQPLIEAIEALKKKVRGADKLDALRLLRQYVVERWEMVDYPAAIAKGWDIGSGPTEAMCKNLTLRLKRTGMKWDADHAAGLMTLIALRENRQWSAYWETRRVA
ncbi:MAG: hypothetical protein ACREEE_12850 [Dongiaceae bacterium]